MAFKHGSREVRGRRTWRVRAETCRIYEYEPLLERVTCRMFQYVCPTSDLNANLLLSLFRDNIEHSLDFGIVISVFSNFHCKCGVI